MADLRALGKSERRVLNTLEGLENFARRYDPTQDESQVAVRLESLEGICKEFYAIRERIEMLTDETSEDEDDKDVRAREKANLAALTEFEERYFRLKASLTSKRAPPPPIATTSGIGQPGDRSESSFSKVKLPEIRLPSFGGRIKEWVPFRDSFCSLIHENKQLNDMDRFSYLKSALSGEALQEIESVELSAANYSVAWKALESRYENKKLIVKAHLDALFAVEGMKRESYDGLSNLISGFEKNLQMLQKIGEDTAAWSTVLAYMVYSRLDPATLRQWETQHNSKDVPTYQNMIAFLRSHCAVLQSVAPVSSKPSGSDYRSSKPSVCHTTVKPSRKCPFCGDSWHPAFICGKFQRLQVAERLEVVSKARLCRNCLSLGHWARYCDKGTCRHCQQKHHTLLHGAPIRSSVPQSQSNPPTQTRQQPQSSQPRPNPRPQTSNASNTTPSNSQRPSTQSPATNTATSTTQTHIALPVTPTHNILLSTALVRVQDRHGNTMLARALLDSCSQHCLMTKEFSSRMHFQASPSLLSVQGIGSSISTSTKLVSAVVRPRLEDMSAFSQEMHFNVLPRLTVSLPTASCSISGWNLPEAAFLADPRFHEPGPVDIIIGAEYYMDLLRSERHKATEDGPTLQNTEFGWIVSGKIPDHPVGGSPSLTFVCSTNDLQDQLTKFWDLETCRSHSTQSLEESACEAYFNRTTVRDEAGRFIVTLPKKESVISRLGYSETTAIKRLMGMERRFAANPELKAMYAEFIREYLELGHMKEVEGDAEDVRRYFLPHHAVLKPDSTTTKLRVVFDASCQTSTGVSLNDALMVGPVVQDDLSSICLRFRTHRIAVNADIAKMYRMIRVQPQDYPLQSIKWRNDPSEPLRTYELTTVTYGTSSAPYLATKCLQRLAEDGKASHPVASEVIEKDFYVDDMLTGVDTVDEGRQLVKEVIELSDSAGFTLRKWNSNSAELLEVVPENFRDERSILALDSAETAIKTLGLAWEPATDVFRFTFPSFNGTAMITKRIVVSDVSRLFDPLGLVGPVIIQAKIFIQELWKQSCGWDDPLSPELQEQWQEYRRNLAGLENLTVPRWVGTGGHATAIELHGFCDASNKAYGACFYVRTISETGEVCVRLLTAKSRVAPLDNLKKGNKRLSTPRLELSSALLLAHLFEKVVSSLGIRARCFFWTDSTIVKCWLSSSPSRWKQFVANRVSEIQHITKDGVWNHVAGLQNPADIISRGMAPAQLQYESLWFSGPYWLRLDECNWPSAPPISEDDFDPVDLEVKSVSAALPVIQPSDIFSLRSSFSDLQRITAWMLRFRYNTQSANRSTRRQGPLKKLELEEATKALVRLCQQESFPQELADLTSGREVRESSKILALNPQLEDGILCVGGRLHHASITNRRKHPYILDHRHPFAYIVVAHYHLKLLHGGQQLIISTVRERFWPTSVRNLVRKVLHECVPCFRVRPKIQDQLMADLPPERVTPCPPFQRVGVDYCGPFQVAYPHRRSRPVKIFVAVYICLVTKAVHLELAADLSAQGFIATLKRFSSRRGKPEIIMCDNGRNFVGARRQLDELRRLFINQQFQSDVVREANEEQIEFRFIPARSPNFGGLWESAVKSFKMLFKRTIGTHTLLYDEMATVLAQAEAVLNSRPLTPLSNDPDDFEALTPGHFLIQRPLTAIPEPDLDGIPENRLSAFQKAQRYTQQLWKNWSKLYLSDLHNRTKWTVRRNNVAVGTMVVLKDEERPPLKWQLGRVTDVHAGEDGNVRVVTVKTKDGSYRRAVSKICVLPIRDNIVSSNGEN
ncbi:uncharacterized protein LOC134288608 [Aedes albopictus]|uniref:Integrase catalytic domain-containing protein n=1 Tax=Aedes albopictus TaxID=7160 RepID=A0ABM1Y2Q4_AEDAL